MALIRQVDLGQATNGAVPLDLEDLRLRAEALKHHAMEEAERIVREARAERKRLIAGAEEKGHAEGLERGLAEGRERGQAEGHAAASKAHAAALAALESAWRGALEAFEGDRREMLRRAREDVLRLAIRMGEKVTKRLVECDEGVVGAQLAEVLALHARPTALTVAVHPDDLALAREAVPGMIDAAGECEHVTIVADGTLTRGSCVARTQGGGVIDATIDGQLARVVEELVPMPAGGGGAGAIAAGEEPTTTPGDQTPMGDAA